MNETTTAPRFRVVTADPPWKFDDRLPGGGRGADKHYRTLELYEIQRFPLPPIDDNAILFLWRVASMVEEAYAVVRAWGFTPKSEIVWVKTGPDVEPFVLSEDDPGLDAAALAMGMGHYVRASHEVAIVATRGRFNVADKGVRSVVFAPRGEHSAKPEIFYTLVTRLGGGAPSCEIFGRRPRPGWLVIGDELPEGRVWMPLNTLAPPAPPEHRQDAAPTPPAATPIVDPGPPPQVPLDRLVPGDVVVASYRLTDTWAEAQARLEADPGSEDDEDPAEIARLPRHRVRRPDGAIVPGLCAALVGSSLCMNPQYASPSGVICTEGHGGAASLPEPESSAPAASAGNPLANGARMPVSPPAASPPNPVLVAADEFNAAQGYPTNQAGQPRPTLAVSGPPADTAPPDASEAKRAVLVERARLEGLLKPEDLAEGLHAAWIKLQYRAPRGWFPPARWFATPPAPAPFLEESRIDVLVNELGARGIPVTLLEASKWSALRRSLAYRWIVEGGETPEWLEKLVAPPNHIDQCAIAGCVGIEGGCPAAIRAWGDDGATLAVDPAAPAERKDTVFTPAAPAAAESTEDEDDDELFPSEVVNVPAENMGELPHTARRASNARAKKGKRGPGRPKGSRNKPKASADPWAAAIAATSFSGDPEPDREEAFFS